MIKVKDLSRQQVDITDQSLTYVNLVTLTQRILTDSPICGNIPGFSFIIITIQKQAKHLTTGEC